MKTDFLFFPLTPVRNKYFKNENVVSFSPTTHEASDQCNTVM